MVFQPTSPIRLFNLPISPRSRNKRNKAVEPSASTDHRRESGVLKKLASGKPVSRPGSNILSADDTATGIVSLNISSGDEAFQPGGLRKSVTWSPVAAVSRRSKLGINTKVKDHTSDSTSSSPTDPLYLPGSSEGRGRLAQFSISSNDTSGSSARPISLAQRSFFDSDTDSDLDSEADFEDDEPVVGRASSVRISKPHIVEQSLSARQRVGYLRDCSIAIEGGAGTPISCAITEVNRPSIAGSKVVSVNAQRVGNPADALECLEGKSVVRQSVSPSFWQPTQDLTDAEGKSPILSEKEDMSSNTPTENDRSLVQRTVSAPVVPPRVSSKRKVQIRPSSLIISPTQHSARSFRETVVTTPYPFLDRVDEKSEESEVEEKIKNSRRIQRFKTIQSAQFDNDRFPSPDRPETLFLDLGLAGHPCATTTLEIKIADKSVFDDEMLFRQIRNAYHYRLLGMSRLPFCFVRGVTHATSSTAVEYDFKTADFMKHFEHPQVGRKRKSWIIWLRHHSRQYKSDKGNSLATVKRPLSASLRTADRRLSMRSESSSPMEFSFLRPLSVGGISFFSKEGHAASPAFSRESSSSLASESGLEIIKIELHHGFSFWTLALLHLWTGVASVAAVVLWVVFGVPGSRPLENHSQGTAGIVGYGLSWNTAAQTRVLTGLVLGMMVAILGAMVEICLIAGAYVLL